MGRCGLGIRVTSSRRSDAESAQGLCGNVNADVPEHPRDKSVGCTLGAQFVDGGLMRRKGIHLVSQALLETRSD